MGHNQGRIEPKRLKGFRDYLPDLMATRLSLMDTIRSEAQLAGFQPIGTPALEYAETLLGHGEETDKQVYRFRDHGDRDVALRFDLTVPFARFVSEHQGQLVFPFKKLHMGEVWRGENTQKGRYREFAQCDLDVIGIDSVLADVEVLGAFQRILSRMNFGAFTMAVGSRTVLSALIRRFLGDLSPAAETSALVAIDKLAKIGPDKVRELLVAVTGPEAAAWEAEAPQKGGASALLQLLTQKDGAWHTQLEPVRAALEGQKEALLGLDRLQSVANLVSQVAGEGQGRLVMDLTVARGLGYYTGVVFETTIDALPGFGSICSGGRYNDLASRFSSKELPGVGGSIGLDRLLAGLEELGCVKPATGGMVLIAIATSDAQGYACQVAHMLRAALIPCDMGLSPKLAQQFKHADRLRCPYVITVGTDEMIGRTCSVKSMADGTEEKGIPTESMVGWLRDRGL